VYCIIAELVTVPAEVKVRPMGIGRETQLEKTFPNGIEMDTDFLQYVAQQHERTIED